MRPQCNLQCVEGNLYSKHDVRKLKRDSICFFSSVCTSMFENTWVHWNGASEQFLGDT